MSRTFQNVTLAVVISLVVGLFALSPGGVWQHSGGPSTSFPAKCVAGSASPITKFGADGVGECEFMTSYAMGLRGWTATRDILSQTARIQMIGIYTFSDAANVVQSQTVWDRTVRQLIRQAMREVFYPQISQMTVSDLVQAAHPQPTGSCFENLRVKDFVQTSKTLAFGKPGQIGWSNEPKAFSVEVAASDVFGNGAWFQMVRVYALRDAATVVKRQFRRYVPVLQFIGESVRPMALTVEGEGSIAQRIDRSDPKPTSRSFQNSGIEGFVNRISAHGQAYHGIEPFLAIVRSANSTKEAHPAV